jgi:hypothetical protein
MSPRNTAILNLPIESQVWWFKPVIPGLRRLKQEESRVQGQPGLHRRPHLKKQEKKNNNRMG